MRERIRWILRRIRRSYRRNRTNWMRGIILAVILLLLVILLGSCACSRGKTEIDETAQRVISISPTPTPTPTEAPRVVSDDAQASSNNVTMINEYLVQKESGSAQ